MNEDELVQKLKHEAPGAPPAPAGEWEAIAARTSGRPGHGAGHRGRGDRALSLPLGARLLTVLGAAAALAVGVMVYAPPDQAREQEILEAYLEDAGQALGGAAEAAQGEELLAMVEGLD